MANEPIQGLPYPELTGVPPNVPEHIKALADAVAPRTVMRFASLAARDAALPTPVDGMVCYVAADNGYYARVGGQWRRVLSDTDWQPLTLQNGWATASGLTPRVRLLDGLVHLTGRVTGGTAGAVAMLPAGMWPDQTMTPAVVNGGHTGSPAFTTLSISPSGLISANTGTSPNLVVPPYPPAPPA